MGTRADDRFKRLRQRMAETDTALVVLGPSSHMQWLSGVHAHPDERPCLLAVSATNAAFLMPALNQDAARAETDLPFFAWADADGSAGQLSALLDSVHPARDGLVALDETMRADFALPLLAALAKARQAFTDATIGHLRASKDSSEFDQLKASALADDRAMRAAWAALKPGMTEIDVADVVRAHFQSEGGRAEFTIIGASENGAFPHHHSSKRMLRRGDAIVMDIGGRLGDYPSDMTRMAVIGEPPPEYETVHAVVDAAVRAAVATARPGTLAREVDRAARDVIAAAGYGQYFVHRTGHGVGLDIHEPPYINATSDTVLREGMVFSIEPGIYLPGRFGVRLEEVVFLRPDGAEILSELSRDTFRVS